MQGRSAQLFFGDIFIRHRKFPWDLTIAYGTHHHIDNPKRNKSVAFTMAKKVKARLVNARLVSMAMTGFFYTFKRPRTAPLMGMMKYDPIVRKKVLFLETKKKNK